MVKKKYYNALDLFGHLKTPRNYRQKKKPNGLTNIDVLSVI